VIRQRQTIPKLREEGERIEKIRRKRRRKEIEKGNEIIGQTLKAGKAGTKREVRV
jgi:hypothetical protein